MVRGSVEETLNELLEVAALTMSPPPKIHRQEAYVWLNASFSPEVVLTIRVIA